MVHSKLLQYYLTVFSLKPTMEPASWAASIIFIPYWFFETLHASIWRWSSLRKMIHSQNSSHIIKLGLFLTFNTAVITLLTSGHPDPQLGLRLHSSWLVPNIRLVLVLHSSLLFDFILYSMASTFQMSCHFSFQRCLVGRNLCLYLPQLWWP